MGPSEADVCLRVMLLQSIQLAARISRAPACVFLSSSHGVEAVACPATSAAKHACTSVYTKKASFFIRIAQKRQKLVNNF